MISIRKQKKYTIESPWGDFIRDFDSSFNYNTGLPFSLHHTTCRDYAQEFTLKEATSITKMINHFISHDYEIKEIK